MWLLVPSFIGFDELSSSWVSGLGLPRLFLPITFIQISDWNYLREDLTSFLVVCRSKYFVKCSWIWILEFRAGKYLPEVFCMEKTEGKYFPVQTEQEFIISLLVSSFIAFNELFSLWVSGSGLLDCFTYYFVFYCIHSSSFLLKIIKKI